MQGAAWTAAAILWAAASVGDFLGAARAQDIQPAPLLTEAMAAEFDSGLVRNDGTGESVIFSRRIFIPGAAALRLQFDEVRLAGFVADGSGSYLRVRSTLDGAEQRLNSLHVRQWRNTSAYFNGDEVVVEIVAQPGTGDNRLRMSTVQAQFEPFADRSICGPTDDRQLSSDNRTARLLPIGCTGWLIHDCNHCFLTAGHCSEFPSDIQVAEFNVPFSDAEGNLNHPPPEDQYAPDLSSRQTNGGRGVGDDYTYFGVFPNSNTGLTPHEAYGEAFQLAMPPQVEGQEIRITGYGVTYNPVPREWSQVQKTHAGPYFSFAGTTLSYQADTTGGNSGSPVIDDSTGRAIGIHTHGGCRSDSGNFGTGLNHPGLQGALANPSGVCECPPLTFSFPEGLPETIDPAGGTTITVEVIPTGDASPEHGTGAFYVDSGSGFVDAPMSEIADNIYTAEFPSIECGVTVRYYFSADSTEGDRVFEPSGAPGQTYAADATRAYSVIVEDDFEAEHGWTVENANLTDGAWVRAAPSGGGERGEPAFDFDGSGWCWVTGDGADSDVDGGPTRLISPAFDLAGAPNAVVSYARWFSNVNSDEDRLTVEVSSDDGQTWATVESVAGAVGWIPSAFRVAEVIPTTQAVRVRFSAADSPNDSVTEAAIDAFRIYAFVCGACPGDFNCDGWVDTIDVIAFLNAWSAGEPSADLNSDGRVDTIDVIAFLNAWNAGC